MNLSIVIVNWNSADYLRTCLRSVYDTTRNIEFEVVVVDNASTAPGLDDVLAGFPHVNLVRLERNSGFAVANNVGVRRSRGEYVLLLNPDTEMVGPAIELMLDQSTILSAAGIIGCRLLNTDQSIQLTATRFPTIANQLMDVEYLQTRWPNFFLWRLGPLFECHVVTEVEVVPGACMLLKREVFDRAGMLNEDYFMYAEDIDLSYRVRRAGYRNYHVGSACVVHHGGKSSSRRSVSHWSTIMKCTSMQMLFSRHRGVVYGALYRVSLGFAACVRLVMLILAKPFGDVVFERSAIETATGKWATVLKWALGVRDARNS